MELKILYFVILFSVRVKSELCPKQCDCDVDNGLNRAMCVNQNLIGIDVGVPKGVQVYSLSHNYISELDNFCFKESGYTSIQALDLSYNLIFWIGLHAFSGLDHLIHLDLSNNRLRQISSDLFSDTPELDALDLSENVFESLNNEPFIMHDKLQILNLNNCRIKALPPRLFTRLPNLRKLDLSENYLATLNTEVLRPLPKLQRIQLRNPYWRCNPEFIAVETWIISHSITYERQCKKRMPNMSEKMISAVVTEREDIDVKDVWNVSTETPTTIKPVNKLDKPMTPFEKFDKNFSSFQAFIIKKRMPNMSEKMISAVVTEREDIDVKDVWNVSTETPTTIKPVNKLDKPMTPFEKFDKNFSSFQAFIIGLEIGLGLGIVGTYIWLRKFCKCGQLDCTRPETRRARRRVQRADADMRSNLLWSSVINPDLETPPLYRRQISLPDRSAPLPTYGLPNITEAGLQVDAIRAPRAETPPPPYNECRINI